MRAAVAAAALLLAAGPARAQPAPGELQLPVSPACVSSPFGPRRLVGIHAARMHLGIDLPAPAGAKVHAAAAGRILVIRRLGADGLMIDIQHGDPKAGGFVTRYAHLGSVSPALAEGKRVVKAGDWIGVVGRSGITYGTHLHFEVRIDGKPVDPRQFISVGDCQLHVNQGRGSAG
jgi:murein DD-endopeptidase MepM/ murein hydrolase activator NlpD